MCMWNKWILTCFVWSVSTWSGNVTEWQRPCTEKIKLDESSKHQTLMWKPALNTIKASLHSLFHNLNQVVVIKTMTIDILYLSKVIIIPLNLTKTFSCLKPRATAYFTLQTAHFISLLFLCCNWSCWPATASVKTRPANALLVRQSPPCAWPLCSLCAKAKGTCCSVLTQQQQQHG